MSLSINLSSIGEISRATFAASHRSEYDEGQIARKVF